MQLKIEYPKIPAELDARRKLSDEDRADIKALRNGPDHLSYNQIAKKFGVSKRLIIFICDPESKKREYARRRERIARGEYLNYDPQKNPEYMRRYRARQRAINGDKFKEYEKSVRTRKRPMKAADNE